MPPSDADLRVRHMSSKTRGQKWLEERGAQFRIVTFIHREKGARASAEALDYPLERIIKSLVVELDPKRRAFVLMAGDRELSLRKLGRATGTRPRMAEPSAAERETGYRVGGISPFGAYAELPVFMEETLILHDEVAINAGHRGVHAFMAPEDIAALLDARLLDLTQ
jgi:Cys-tRNA(Pro)/Cys-tRNA(Cys) deacylase